MQCRIFRDPVMNRRVDSDPNHIETLGIGKYYPKRGRPYKDMNEFSSMILDIDIKKDERRIDPQSGEYFYYKKAINYFADRLHSILSDRDKYVILFSTFVVTAIYSPHHMNRSGFKGRIDLLTLLQVETFT